MAYAAERLLDDEYLPQLQVEEIASLTRLGAIRRGILRDGQICPRTLTDFLGEMAADNTFFRIHFNGVGDTSLRQALRGRTVLRQPLRTILLLRRLYGTWGEVEHAANVPENLGIGPEDLGIGPDAKRIGSSYSRKRKAIEAAKAFYGPGAPGLYDLYVDTQKKNPSLSKSELFKLLPWHTRSVLSAEQRDAADLEALGDVDALDTSMAAHILARADAIPQLITPVQRTTTSLLAGHPKADAWPHIKKFLPAATAAMRKCVEERRRYLRRISVSDSRAARKNVK